MFNEKTKPGYLFVFSDSRMPEIRPGIKDWDAEYKVSSGH